MAKLARLIEPKVDAVVREGYPPLEVGAAEDDLVHERGRELPPLVVVALPVDALAALEALDSVHKNP